MRTRFVEASQSVESGFNWGKFLIGVFDPDEWRRPSEMAARTPPAPRSSSSPAALFESLYLASPSVSLLRSRGWTPQHVLVFDIETGEGAMFLPGGSPSADLNKHRIWVCPMFEPFLAFLYQWIEQRRHRGDDEWFVNLPALVELPGVPGAMAGYRREGPK